jgi:hypothetical protein
MDIATPLYAALKRVNSTVTDAIAKDGLRALKRTIDAAKFPESEYLKDYEIYAHVIGNEIEFEIVLNIEAVEPADEVTRKAMEEEKTTQEEELRRDLARTYGWHMRGPRRLRDARKPSRDARIPLRDARTRARDIRKTSNHRLLEHEMALRNPRSAEVTPEGKLSVSLRRTVRETEKEVRLPQGKFQGVIDKFMKNLSKVIAENFAVELQEIIQKYVK